MKKISKKTVSQILSVFSYIILLLLLVLTVYLLYCKFTSKVPFIGKNAVIRILTDSMEPTIGVGEFIIIEKCDPSTLQKGDIITFYSMDTKILGNINTHRIYDINEANGEITTKGDNNPGIDDAKVYKNRIVGKYVRSLKVISAVMMFITTPLFLILAVFLLAVLLVILKASSPPKKAENQNKE